MTRSENQQLPPWMQRLAPELQQLYQSGHLEGISQDFLEGCRAVMTKKLKPGAFVNNAVVSKDNPPRPTYENSNFVPDRYRWLVGKNKLGSGGQGDVYEGYDTALGRPVAIKILEQIQAYETTHRHDFEREAKTLANLDHPALVKVYDFVVNGNELMIVMQKLESSEYDGLDKVKGKQNQAQFLNTIASICDVIDYCATQGVYHQDLKPGNILVDKVGKVKLIDFGISNWVREKTAEMAASLRYVSPEALTRSPEARATIQSEIFSVGNMVYELITGENYVSHQGSMMETMKLITERPKMTQEMKDKLRAAAEKLGFDGDKVVELVEKTHELDPQDRYSSGRQLFSDIAAAKKR
jgi:serine/threonine protein kinase